MKGLDQQCHKIDYFNGVCNEYIIMTVLLEYLNLLQYLVSISKFHYMIAY